MRILCLQRTWFPAARYLLPNLYQGQGFDFDFASCSYRDQAYPLMPLRDLFSRHSLRFAAPREGERLNEIPSEQSKMVQTVTTHWHKQNRVSFSHPDGSFAIEDLELLEAAIKHARRRIVELAPATEPDESLPLQPTLQQSYAEQLERQSAPT